MERYSFVENGSIRYVVRRDWDNNPCIEVLAATPETARTCPNRGHLGV